MQNFTFTSVSDLVQEPPEETSFVWGRILTRAGVSIIGAKPKVGKSTFGRCLANAVASDEEFLGYPTTLGKVLCIALEEKRAEVTDHFRRLGAHQPNLIVHVGPSPKNPLEALKAAIEEHSPTLIEIDPLSRFLHVADLSAYAEVTRHLEPIIDLARKYGPHILIPHHNKKGKGESGEDDLLGSTGLFGVDTLLIMRKRQGRRTLQSAQRYGDDLRETVINFDPDTGTVTAGEEMAGVLLREKEDAILYCLSQQSFLSESAIKGEVGGGGLTSKALRALFNAGRIHRQGSGKKGDPFLYGLTPL